MLGTFLTSPEAEQWTQRLLTTVDETREVQSYERSGEKKYIGELEVIHGTHEAHDMIRRGKFKETTDAWGDKVYVKVTEKATHSKSKSSTASTSRHAVFFHQLEVPPPTKPRP